MATARRLLVDPATSGVFHCVSRCVRRAFLCGRDEYSGQDYEHRRLWIQDRLRELAGLFSVEIFAYSVMSNHVHIVVRTLPGQVRQWEDTEVARRWLALFPGPGARKDRGHTPEQSAIRDLCKDHEKLARCRERLADLSWFMRCLNEPIARRANREDECTGRFWEGRFKCQKLDDEGAILACMAYVDLNPVRAAIAAALDQSEFTSAQDRVVALRARRQLASAPPPRDPNPQQAAFLTRAKAEATRDHWLAPLGTSLPENGKGATSPEGNPGESSSADSVSALAHLTEETYLELLDWTGREMRAGKRGHLSPHLRPILQDLELDVEAWVDSVEGFGGLFQRIAAKLGRLRELARASGRAWLGGHRGARQLYASVA